MLLTYGILTVLSIQLMRSKRRKNLGGSDEGNDDGPALPIVPDLPKGVIWPSDVVEEELLV